MICEPTLVAFIIGSLLFDILILLFCFSLCAFGFTLLLVQRRQCRPLLQLFSLSFFGICNLVVFEKVLFVVEEIGVDYCVTSRSFNHFQ